MALSVREAGRDRLTCLPRTSARAPYSSAGTTDGTGWIGHSESDGAVRVHEETPLRFGTADRDSNRPRGEPTRRVRAWKLREPMPRQPVDPRRGNIVFLMQSCFVHRCRN